MARRPNWDPPEWQQQEDLAMWQSEIDQDRTEESAA